MTIESFQAWLQRRPKGPAPKKPIPKRTPDRAAQERRYRVLAKQYLVDHPICEVWLKEHGWTQAGGFYANLALGFACESAASMFQRGALPSTQIHHKGKRRGAMLCNVEQFLAVCPVNHARVEMNLSWARQQGFSLNF